MSHALEFGAIDALLRVAQEELKGPDRDLQVIVAPLIIAIRRLATIVEANERGHAHDTEPPPAPPTEPGDPPR